MSTQVSVILSAYKPDRTHFAEQLESIAQQSYENLSVIVRDDDPSGEDLSEFCREHCPGRELIYLRGEKNLGYVGSFEELIRYAAPRGGVIALCDQDDRWLPNRVERCLAPLEEGALLCACDRSIIDGAGVELIPSWRAAHPKERASQWQTGDRFIAESVFTSFAPGMAVMLKADLACSLLPVSQGAAHDMWLMCGANILGECAFINEPLVQYRRHGKNVSGVLHGVSCKQDWYETRVEVALRFATEMKRRFPACEELDAALALARARSNRNVGQMLRYRHLAPELIAFELALALTPAPLFKLALKLYQRA